MSFSKSKRLGAEFFIWQAGNKTGKLFKRFKWIFKIVPKGNFYMQKRPITMTKDQRPAFISNSDFNDC